MGFLLPAAIVVVVDQVSKQIAWHSLLLGLHVDLIPGVLRLTLVKNKGAAFGLLEGGRIFFIIASVVAAVFITYLGFHLPKTERVKRLLLGLILGGAVGNLIDRVYDGAVIDFVEMGIAGYWWPVYNVADIAVTVGAVALLVHVMATSRRQDEAGVRPGGSAAADDGGAETKDR